MVSSDSLGWHEQHGTQGRPKGGWLTQSLGLGRSHFHRQYRERRTSMVKRLVFAVAILAVSATTAVVFAQRQGTNTAPATGRYLPEYTKEGDLILPKNWRSWVYVGSPLTPDGLNDNKEGFPEYYNVYIEPGSYESYKKTGEFPDGTIMFKELQ